MRLAWAVWMGFIATTLLCQALPQSLDYVGDSKSFDDIVFLASIDGEEPQDASAKESAGAINNKDDPNEIQTLPQSNDETGGDENAPPSDPAEQKRMAEFEETKKTESPGSETANEQTAPTGEATQPHMTPDDKKKQKDEEKQSQQQNTDRAMLQSATNSAGGRSSTLQNMQVVEDPVAVVITPTPTPTPAPIDIQEATLPARCHIVKTIVCDNETSNDTNSLSPSPSVTPSPVPLIFPDGWENPQWAKTLYSPTPSPSSRKIPGVMPGEVTAADRALIMSLIDQKRTHVVRKKNHHVIVPEEPPPGVTLHVPPGPGPASIAMEKLAKMVADYNRADGASNATDKDAAIASGSPPSPANVPVVATTLAIAPVTHIQASSRSVSPPLVRAEPKKVTEAIAFADDEADFMMALEPHTSGPHRPAREDDMAHIAVPANEHIRVAQLAMPAQPPPHPAIAIPLALPRPASRTGPAVPGESQLVSVAVGGQRGGAVDRLVSTVRAAGWKPPHDTAAHTTIPATVVDAPPPAVASSDRLERRRDKAEDAARVGPVKKSGSLSQFAEALAKPSKEETQIIQKFEEMVSESNPQYPSFLQPQGKLRMDPNLQAMIDHQGEEMYNRLHALETEAKQQAALPVEDMSHDTIASTMFGWAENGPKPWEMTAPSMEEMRAGLRSTVYDMFHSDKIGNFAPRPVGPQGARAHGTRPIIDQTVESGDGVTIREDGTERIKMNKCGEWVWDLSAHRCVPPAFIPLPPPGEQDDKEKRPKEREPIIPRQDFEDFAPPPDDSLMIPPSRSPSPTPTPSPSEGATPSASPSLTPSRSASPSASISRGASASRTPSRTPSASRSLSPSPSASAPPKSRSASPSVSISPSPSPSVSELPEEDCCGSPEDLPEQKEIFDEGFQKGYDSGFDSGLKVAWQDIQKGVIDPEGQVKAPDSNPWERSVGPAGEDEAPSHIHRALMMTRR